MLELYTLPYSMTAGYCIQPKPSEGLPLRVTPPALPVFLE